MTSTTRPSSSSRDDVGAAGHRRAAGRAQRPREARERAVAVGLAARRETQAGELRARRLDHAGDAVVALAATSADRRSGPAGSTARPRGRGGVRRRARSRWRGSGRRGRMRWRSWRSPWSNRDVAMDACSRAPARPVHYLAGHGRATGRCYLLAMTSIASSNARRRRRPRARLAPAAPPQPARARRRGRHLHAPPELRRERPLGAQPQHAAAPGRAPGHAAARPQRDAARRGLRGAVRRAARWTRRRCRRRGARSMRCCRRTRRFPRWPSIATGRWWPATPPWRRCWRACRPRCCKATVNVLRLSLHPDGLAPRIANLAEWRAHLLARLQQQVDALGRRAARGAAGRAGRLSVARGRRARRTTSAASPCRCACASTGLAEPLSLISTTTVFGTPVDVTLSELALECFYPADERTREWLQRGAAIGGPPLRRLLAAQREPRPAATSATRRRRCRPASAARRRR